MSPEALRATWTELAEPARTAITGALVAAADAELQRLDTFWPASYGDSPVVEVLGIVGGRVHFLACALNYNFAQSGSDWADHYVLAGDAALDGGDVHLTLALHHGIREYDWADYQPAPAVDEVRAKTIAKLVGTP